MLSLLVDAVVAGATAAVEGSVSDALRRTYDHLRSLLSKDEDVSKAVSLLEQDPSSEARAAVVSEALGKSALCSDDDVLEAAQELVDGLRSAYPLDSTIIRRLEGRNILVRGFETASSTVVLEDFKAGEDISFEDLHVNNN